MVYRINYSPNGETNSNKEHTMFDIEYYETQDEERKKYWYSELHTLPMVTGIAQFIKDSLADKDFDFDGFVKDAEEIANLRRLLFEHYDNKLRIHSSSYVFHYGVFGDVLQEKINAFAEKYKLLVNTD